MRVRLTLLVSALAVLPVLTAGGVAQAAEVVDIEITQDGPQPQQLTVDSGDTVRFVNTDTFVHRVVSDSSGWAFDTRALVPGETYTVQPALTRPGTYSYRGADLDSFRGSVLVPGAVPPSPAASSPAPTRAASPAAPPASSPANGSPTPTPTPTASGSASPAASGAPVASGGTGSVQGPPPLAGGSFQDLAPEPLVDGPTPQVAPDEAPAAGLVDPFVVPSDGPSAGPADPAASPQVALPPTAAGAPALSSPVEARRYGLPLALALVGITGVVSLLVRLLLAEAPSGSRTA